MKTNTLIFYSSGPVLSSSATHPAFNFMKNFNKFQAGDALFPLLILQYSLFL